MGGEVKKDKLSQAAALRIYELLRTAHRSIKDILNDEPSVVTDADIENAIRAVHHALYAAETITMGAMEK